MSMKPWRFRRALPYFLLILGAGMAVGAVASWVRPLPQPTKSVVAGPTPSAVKPKPSAVEAYTVAPDLPRYIEIPQIGVPKSRVMGLSTDTKQQIAVPNNLFDVGWYKQSGKPGEAGAMFMYGHVSGWQANGVFYNLYQLRAGDTVTVTRGDNAVFTYTVVATKRYPVSAVDMAAALAPVTRGRQGLNLMTCAGKMDEATGEFSERLVVFTSLVTE
jgi:LPXTG-site transpeptidase (sortase) family protein